MDGNNMAIKTRKILLFLTLILCISTVFAMNNSEKKHTLDYQYTLAICPFPGCKKTFKDVHDLLNHMREKHANRKTKKCNFPKCTKISDSWAHLKEHMYHHLTEKYFCCPVCSKKFKWLKHLKKHLKEHTPEQDTTPDNPETQEDLENLECLKNAELELFLEQCNAHENSNS
jgi:hypothetical protein